MTVPSISSLLCTTLGAVGNKPATFWMPEQASGQAASVDRVFDLITWISIFFFVLVVTLLVIFTIKYRRRSPLEKATSDVTHNTPLELTWTIVPLILVIAIFYVGMEGFLNLRNPPIGAYQVDVTAAKWSWTFRHPGGCTDSTLHVPVNTPVKCLMQSSDVLHALYIPAFRVKQDVVPGRITYLWFEATKEGEFDLYCAEYCGKDHSQMRTKVVVHSAESFAAYMDECMNYIDRTDPEDYAAVALEKIYPRCASCHSLDGKDGTGPSWRGLWAKLEKGDHVFTDGTRLGDIMGPGKTYASPEDYVRQSVLRPQQHIVMNFSNAMPPFQGLLKDKEVDAIIAALKELDRFDEKGKLKAGG